VKVTGWDGRVLEELELASAHKRLGTLKWQVPAQHERYSIWVPIVK
jgi:hypothetical protein